VAPPPDPPDPPGEDEAFSAFYRRFVPILVAFLVWQGARLDVAADVAQEAMIKAYKNWSKIRQPEAWARSVAYRDFIRYRIDPPAVRYGDPPEHSCLLRPLTNVEAWEQQHEILRLLRHLPERQRQVLAWTLDGYTAAEIAEVLERTPEAVRASLMKARRTLTRLLGMTGEER
jgi:RNA polymerase sigma-70 factor (ECF subfamily)